MHKYFEIVNPPDSFHWRCRKCFWLLRFRKRPLQGSIFTFFCVTVFAAWPQTNYCCAVQRTQGGCHNKLSGFQERAEGGISAVTLAAELFRNGLLCWWKCCREHVRRLNKAFTGVPGSIVWISCAPTPDDLPEQLWNVDVKAAIETFSHVKVKVAFADIDFWQGGDLNIQWKQSSVERVNSKLDVILQ